MTDRELHLTRFIPADSSSVFQYWVSPTLLEQWSFPEGMSLKVTKFEARPRGKYRFEHTGRGGVFACNGHLSEFVPNKRLVMIDTVRSPDGRIMMDGLESEIDFRPVSGGTEISVVQRGFPDNDTLRDCEQGWIQSLNNLEQMLGVGQELQPGL